MARLPENMTKILLRQGHLELSNSINYLQIAYWASRKNFPGTAAYFRFQYHEETTHALSFFDYLDRRSEFVNLEHNDKPKGEYKSPVDVFQIYYDREYFNTNSISNIVTEANKCNDWPTVAFLKEFLDEQLREVAIAEELLAKATAYASNPALYYEFDKELKSYLPTANPSPSSLPPLK